MRYTDVWNKLTEEMGYWVNMDDPYITYKTKYIESVWWLLRQLYDKGLLYKGYTIQPYSPKAGTGLSSHELNQPGTYRDVKDNTIVAMFKVTPPPPEGGISGAGSPPPGELEGVFLLAWTTTPWTLPSNTALTVGEKIDYAIVNTYNQYSGEAIRVILAKALIAKQFSGKYTEVDSAEALKAYNEGDKKIPYYIEKVVKGADIIGIGNGHLLPYALQYESAEEAFYVFPGELVTTEDSTVIVHPAPSFGADDMPVAVTAGVRPMWEQDVHDNPV